MRKADLRKLPRLHLTSHMAATCRKDTGIKSRYGLEYNYSCYYRAAVHEEILFVAIWERNSVIRGKKEPDVEIYIDKNNSKWLNYYTKRDSWGEARVENLDYCTGRYGMDWYMTREYSTGGDKQKVNAYFANPKGQDYSIREAVRKWQKEIVNERLQFVHRKELEEIDTVMAAVPDLPKNFTKWASTGGYKKSQYMIYDRGKKDAFCTACNRHMAPKAAWRHNEPGKCPKCRAEVTYKSFGKQKTIQDEKQIGIMLPLKNNTGYILRIFHTKIIRYREKSYKKEYFMWEKSRILIANNFARLDDYKWGEYKNTGITRWCHEVKYGGYYYYDLVSDEVVLYPQNLKAMLKSTDLKYSNIWELFKKKEGCYIRLIPVLQTISSYPVTEALLKVGLNNYVLDLCRNPPPKTWKRESPWTYLEISKDYYRMAIEHDSHWREINVMRSATRNNVRLTYEQISFYTTYLHGMTDRLFVLGHQERLYKYMFELMTEKKTRLGDYMDYLDDLDYLHIPKTKDVLFPKNFMELHLEIADQARCKRDTIAHKKQREKDRLYRKLVPDLKNLYACEDENLKIIIPTCKNDFTTEGQQNHNCVGGVYFDKVLREQSVVVFLRKKEDLSASYCTVEFDMNGNVLQNRAKFNREAPTEAVAFINKLSNRVKKELRKRKLEAIKQAERMAENQVLQYAT